MPIGEVLRRGEDRVPSHPSTEEPVKKEVVYPKKFGAFLHTYQPPRKIRLIDGDVIDVLADTNGKILERCYRSMLVEGDEFPAAIHTSFYGPTRDWMKKDHKTEWEKVQAKIKGTENREYRFFGDPYLHVILPLLDPKDQDMLIKIGKKAFKEDFDFEPKVIWLPETAVSTNVLKNLYRNGYEAVILQANQLWEARDNPVFIEVVPGQYIAVVHFIKSWSEKISRDKGYTGYPDSGPKFRKDVKDYWDNNFFIGTDLETFGEHLEFRDNFIKWVSEMENLIDQEISPANLGFQINGENKTKGTIIENSSWSCNDGLGRWTGECKCGCANGDDEKEKKHLYGRLRYLQGEISSELDGVNPKWREDFIKMFLEIRGDFFTGRDVYGQLENEFPCLRYRNLLIAKLYSLIGMTSCGWFEAGKGQPERQIPRKMLGEVENLWALDQELKNRVLVVA